MGEHNEGRVGWYRKRPVEVQAMRWLPENMTAAGWVVGWMQANGCDPEVGDGKRLLITTLEGVMAADPEDVIIRGVQGEFYPCKPDIFQATYEAVQSPLSGASSASSGATGVDDVSTEREAPNASPYPAQGEQ